MTLPRRSPWGRANGDLSGGIRVDREMVVEVDEEGSVGLRGT